MRLFETVIAEADSALRSPGRYCTFNFPILESWFVVVVVIVTAVGLLSLRISTLLAADAHLLRHRGHAECTHAAHDRVCHRRLARHAEPRSWSEGGSARRSPR